MNGGIFLNLVAKTFQYCRLGGRRERRGGQKMQKAWHVWAGDKGHLLDCLKEGPMCILFPSNMPGKAVGESVADDPQYTF